MYQLRPQTIRSGDLQLKAEDLNHKNNLIVVILPQTSSVNLFPHTVVYWPNTLLNVTFILSLLIIMDSFFQHLYALFVGKTLEIYVNN